MKHFLLVISFFGVLFSNDLKLREGNYTFSYDAVSLPQNETLGLLGKKYLVDINDYYFGIGVYSAVYGKRGGFFTGGVEFGHQYYLTKNIFSDLGMFIGGGGGGAAPQGGGLMLRPQLTLNYDAKSYSAGLGVSKVRFPNGDIDSEQLTFQLSFPFESIYTLSNKINYEDILAFENIYNKEVSWNNSSFSVVLHKYMVPRSVKNTGGTNVKEDMNLVGAEYRNELNKNSFFYIETLGNAGGEADGYAEITSGIGYKISLFKSLDAYGKFGLGASGGGKVETGGGLIHKEAIGLKQKIFDNISLTGEYGYINAFDGDFYSPTAKIGFNYDTKFLSIGESLRKVSSKDIFETNEWNIRLVNQIYLKDKSIRKNQSDDTPVDLIGLKIDRYILENLFISGQAFGAYRGKAGGYATGLVGLGYRFELIDDLNYSVEALAGAAGGGNIATDGGAIIQPMMSLEYEVNEELSLAVSYGKIKAMKGLLDTNVIEFGLNYKFKTIE